MIYIGCDNGINGGLAVYDSDTNKLEVIAMPIVRVAAAKGNKNKYAIPEIVAWFKTLKEKGIRLVVLEKAQPFPGMGASQTFTNAENYGIVEGILSALEIPFVLTHCKTWQKKLFDGIPHKGREQCKQASVLVAQRLFPGVKFVPNDKSTKLHDGMTDAALMSYYGYLQHNADTRTAQG